ncbi:MAG: ABC transporter ATP-binding protein [Chloroflexi bacterium]|nr:MAG: ABC transporter ATP-binding protein [Chloroflexota bacterium]
MISLHEASYTYPNGGVVALDSMSVEVGEGEIVGVMGQNGSGKTTFTKLLNGLLRPTSGSVFINGRDTSRYSVQALAPHVGYVFQNPNHQVFANTVAEELAFGPLNIGHTPEEVAERVAEAAEFFELGAIMQLHPYRISFPMRKLVGIASIFTMRPQVFILDEPTTGQDHKTSSVIDRLILRLGERGNTVICVSHDMPLIAHVTKRALVMWNGKLIADAPPREIFSDKLIMERTHLTPPQITQLSMRMPGRASRPGALSIAELVASVRSEAMGDPILPRSTHI